VIFELKRGVAGEDAVLQAIGYAQRAERWVYPELERRYRAYLQKCGFPPRELRDAHKDAFQLDISLEPTRFNERQYLYVVGNAANEALIDAIDYWKGQGLSVEFLPYRIYDVQGTRYFEFFSFPYDRHRNPSAVRGVLFDTNRSYDENSVWEMMESPGWRRTGMSSTWWSISVPGISCSSTTHPPSSLRPARFTGRFGKMVPKNNTAKCVS